MSIKIIPTYVVNNKKLLLPACDNLPYDLSDWRPNNILHLFYLYCLYFYKNKEI